MIKYLKYLALATLLTLETSGTALAVTINTNIPGMNTVSDSGPTGFVYNFYQLSLMISGVLAFGAIVYGGVKYTVAAGNPGGQSEGKEWIKGALLGLLLLVSAYIVLRTINPKLVNLELPTLDPPASTGSGGEGF